MIWLAHLKIFDETQKTFLAEITLNRAFFFDQFALAWALTDHSTKWAASGFLAVVRVMSETNKVALRLRVGECPRCRARFLVRKACFADFGGREFESYKIICKSCGALLTAKPCSLASLIPTIGHVAVGVRPSARATVSRPFLRQKAL